MSISKPLVSSPNATGNSGAHFEQHVDAAFLAWLLVRAVPPVLIDCTLSCIHLQTERLGWKTDDLVAVADNGAGLERKLVCQIKQTITVSASDDEFAKTIRDAWGDFKNKDLFDCSNDRLAIVCLRGTDAFLRHFSGLLDCARASRTAYEFEERLSTKGFVHAKVVSYLGEVNKVIEEVEGGPIDKKTVWEFLRLLHALSFDLNTPTRQTESQVISLLAHTAGEANPIAVATATWNELLREVGEGKPQAMSYSRDNLASSLRGRHSPIAGKDTAALQRLKEHSHPVLDGIRTTIGLGEDCIELPRSQLVQSILERLQDTRVILVTGIAGSGKSAVIRKVAEHLEQDFFTFAFRAEEFGVTHLDEVLQKAQIGVNGVALGAILSGQSKKVIFIESVERLLEATTRDAFADFLMLLKGDPSWLVVLTCRDYSADLVRSSLLQLVNLEHGVVAVPSLSEGELASVAAAFPGASHLIAKGHLRALLSNPYMLDKATQMPWPTDRPLPENERAFRKIFWEEIVRVAIEAANGMPHRRHETFIAVSLQRARTLRLYAPRDGLDGEALDKLVKGSLVVVSDRTDSLVAPAHDVLEDWAILNWIDEQYVCCGDDLTELAEKLGTFPAIRRSYRKWLDELVDRDATSADSLFTQALTDTSIPAHFRDDTLVALLRSSAPGEFISRHIDFLFSDEKRLLKRLIHLLRVGCVTTPDWFEGGKGLGFDFHIPDGDAWGCILELVASRFSEFGEQEASLLVGLIEDAAKGVTWRSPYPAGSNSVAAIAHWLLPRFDDYSDEELRKRTLRVITKLPKCEESKFRALLAGRDKPDERDLAADDLRELILSGMEGNSACRDVPDAVIAATRDVMFLTEDDLNESDWFAFSGMDMEPLFGIKPNMAYKSFPASAYHGPLFFLLRHHFALGNKFLVELINHSAAWYISGRVPMEYVEPPFKISLTFNDGTTRDQWANARLWNLYRGTSVGPYSLQSALMAFERNLLEIAEFRPDILDALLISTLRASESVAITSVAASVATAHPHACPETLFVLLRSRVCIQLDRQRLVSESQRPSLMSGYLPLLSGDKTHDQERKDADALPHRGRDLENAIVNLQLGAHAPRVQEFIDDHLQVVPPAEQRSDEDRIWFLSLRRMDLRQYETSGEVIQQTNKKPDSDEEPRKMIRMDLRVDDEDVEAMSRDSAAEHAEFENRIGLQMWGIRVFEGVKPSEFDPALWKSKLATAQEISESRGPEPLKHSGPEFVASVCIRDHFDELSHEETRWCVETVCSAIEETSNQWNRHERMQRYSMQADRPCAWAVSAIVDNPNLGELSERVRNAFAIAITHPNDEVRTYATNGVAMILWSSNAELATHSVNVLAFEATLIQSLWKAEQSKAYGEREELDLIACRVGQHIRSVFYDGIPKDAHENLDVSDWIGSEANCRILVILLRNPQCSMAIDAFSRVASVLVQWWDKDDERRSNSGRREGSRFARVNLPSLLEDFVLRVQPEAASVILQPIVEAMERHPREVSQIIQGMIGAEDRSPSKVNFWHIWQLFADRLKTTSLLDRIDRKYSIGSEVYSAIFLTQYWKEGIRHWQGLSEGVPNGHAHRVHALFDALPPTSILLDCYTRFLYHIGETCLPDAFTRIASKLQTGNPPELLRRSNTVFMLESLLRRYVYSRPIEIKRKERLRESVLYLLDTLVECGSSSAYRMRDDFVTPMS